MSISYTARVISGFRLSLIEVREQRTKYNEDTGQPYQITVPAGVRVEVDGKPVLGVEGRVNRSDILVGESLAGMTVFMSGYDAGEYFLGSDVGKVADYREQWCELPDIDASEAVCSFADQYKVQPRLFLIMSCG